MGLLFQPDVFKKRLIDCFVGLFVKSSVCPQGFIQTETHRIPVNSGLATSLVKIRKVDFSGSNHYFDN